MENFRFPWVGKIGFTMSGRPETVVGGIPRGCVGSALEASARPQADSEDTPPAGDVHRLHAGGFA